MRVIKDIIGKEVLSKNAEVLGKVHDVEIDERDFTIITFILKKPGFSVTKEEIIVSFSAVKTIGDKILLDD
ncbi:MAG: PRC-barrel domain-containing protein [Methanobrevibacter sp.]|nr:PRC-barrel domain-containing protein [Candidatus Methanoflexus mossambicus]